MKKDILSQKKIIAYLLRNSLTEVDVIDELVDTMFDDDEIKEQLNQISEDYLKPNNREARLCVHDVNIRAINTLISICKNKKIGILPFSFSTKEGAVKNYKSNDKISVLILSTQSMEFNHALLEAYAIHGILSELNKDILISILKNTEEELKVLELHGLNKTEYERILLLQEKLSDSVKFTMFPEKNVNGKIDVCILAKTKESLVNGESGYYKNGPYSIAKILMALLGSVLLENSDIKKKIEKEKVIKENLYNEVQLMDKTIKDSFYLTPLLITRNGELLLKTSDSLKVNKKEKDLNKRLSNQLELEELLQYAKDADNFYVIPLTQEEYELSYNGFLDYKKLNVIKKVGVPDYISNTERSLAKIGQNLIHLINQKREEILLASDDFNGNNLINLSNYVSCTIHELIMREDDEYGDYKEEKKEIQQRIREVLNSADKRFSLSYAFEDHDKVTELIEQERNILVGKETSVRHEDIDR